MRLGFWIISGCAVLLTLTPSWAVEFKYLRCAKYAVSLKLVHAYSARATPTKDAIDFLGRFRNRLMREYRDVEPGNAPTVATQRSTGRTRQKAARRIAALIHEHGNFAGVFGHEGLGVMGQVMLGAVFRGEQAIQKELESRRMWSRATDIGEQAHAMMMVAGYPALIGAMAYVATLHPLLALFAYVNRHLPEEFIRGFGVYHWGLSEDAQIRRRLRHLQSGTWFYHSFDLQMRQSIIDDLLRHGNAEPDHPGTFITDQRYARWVVDATGIPWNSHYGEGLPRYSKGWMRVDQLLTQDPGGEPVLVVVLRALKTLPPYPRKVPEKSPVVAPQPSWVPVPVPVPAR